MLGKVWPIKCLQGHRLANNLACQATHHPPPPQATRHAQIASPREKHRASGNITPPPPRSASAVLPDARWMCCHGASGNTSNTERRIIARKAPTHIPGQQGHRASDPASLRANPTQVPMLLEFRIFHHVRTRRRPRCRPRRTSQGRPEALKALLRLRRRYSENSL